MESACSSQPNASNGETVSIPSELFTTSLGNSSNSTSGSVSSPNSTASLSNGTKAGIGIGVAAGIALICVLLWWLYRQLRRRNYHQSIPTLEMSASPEDSKPDYSLYPDSYYVGSCSRASADRQNHESSPVEPAELPGRDVHEMPAQKHV